MTIEISRKQLNIMSGYPNIFYVKLFGAYSPAKQELMLQI